MIRFPLNAACLILVFHPAIGFADDVKIGVVLPLSGPGSPTSAELRRGIEFAADEINRDGGIHSLGGTPLVPEDRRIFSDFTVLENLQAGALVRNGCADQEQDMRRVFSLFPALEQKQELAAASLSGGEQQMLAIGRALMSAPRLLMIDEPSLGLSPIVLRDPYNALALLAGSGLSVLVAEQNLRVALRVAQRGYVLRHGEVIFHGSASELRNRTDLPELYLGKAVFKEEG